MAASYSTKRGEKGCRDPVFSTSLLEKTEVMLFGKRGEVALPSSWVLLWLPFTCGGMDRRPLSPSDTIAKTIAITNQSSHS